MLSRRLRGKSPVKDWMRIHAHGEGDSSPHAVLVSLSKWCMLVAWCLGCTPEGTVCDLYSEKTIVAFVEGHLIDKLMVERLENHLTTASQESARLARKSRGIFGETSS